MNNKYTDAPWTINTEQQFYNGNKAFEINFGEDGECVAEIVHGEANAHLVSAAPELLEALQEIVAISDRKHDAWDKAKSAIAKALNQ